MDGGEGRGVQLNSAKDCDRGASGRWYSGDGEDGGDGEWLLEISVKDSGGV